MKLLLYTLLCFSFSLIFHWPGSLTPDSINQLNQAKEGIYTDWHPPIMAWMWHYFLKLGYKYETLFLLQIILHWLGIGLIANTLRSANKNKYTFLILLTGFTPIALKYTGIIQKDTLMTSFLIFGFAISLYSNKLVRYLSIIFILLGLLIRFNGVFAAPPLIFLAFRFKFSLLKNILYSILLSLLLIPFSQNINHSFFEAERTRVERGLQLYDIVGTAYFSGDLTLLPVRIDNLKKCYTPLFWDTLTTERCNFAYSKIDENISHLWIKSIIANPVSYVKHRIFHFNSTIFFLVPPAHQCIEAPEMHDCPRSLRSDAIAKNGLVWPVTWLSIGFILLMLGLAEIPRALCMSGFLYGIAYIFIGVASDLRYFYWTEFSIQIALLLQLSIYTFPRWRTLLSVLIIILLTGYYWRYIDFIK